MFVYAEQHSLLAPPLVEQKSRPSISRRPWMSSF